MNQPLLTEVILECCEGFMVVMNNGIAKEFYKTVFKPQILMKD
jgi:hypothetical protein